MTLAAAVPWAIMRPFPRCRLLPPLVAAVLAACAGVNAVSERANAVEVDNVVP